MNFLNCILAKAKFSLAFLTAVALYGCGAKDNAIDYLGQKPPGVTAELFAPGIISTNSMEHSAPAFSPDGKVVLWTVVNKSYRASMLEMSYESGKWSTPRRPSFADSTADDYYPSFAPNGKKLYFSSRRKLPFGYPDNRDIRIWEVEKTRDGWGIPQPLDTALSRGGDYAHSITGNGTIYFTSSVGGGSSWNIKSSENSNGAFAKPVLLPYNINSVDYEDGPYISPDESFLIFESQRPEGIDGGIDLYISFKSNGTWSTPVNMGPRINTGSTERFARLSPDGKYLFFGSNRNQSKENWGFDIFWIDAQVIEDLRVKPSDENLIVRPLGDDVILALSESDADRSATMLKQWLNHHPNSLDATIIYGSVLRRQKRYVECEQLLAANASRWNENPGFTMALALSKFATNKDDEAGRILAPLLAEGDQFRERCIYLSRELLAMGRVDVSEEYFERAMAIHPSSFPYLNRACALARVGMKDRAFLALNKAAELGGVTRKDFEAAADLNLLKSDARWQTLMEKMR